MCETDVIPGARVAGWTACSRPALVIDVGMLLTGTADYNTVFA